MAFALQRDITFAEHRSVFLNLRMEASDRAAADLRCFVRERGLAVDDVLDPLIAQDLDFDTDPLVAVVSLRSRVDAMGCEELAVHLYVGSRSAQVGGRARAF